MNRFDNADSKEIEKFDRVAQTWWYSKGEMRMLHTINPLRTHFIMERVTDPNPIILDVGCGGGILSVSLTRAGAQVTGVDLSAASIQAARQYAQAQGLKIDYRYESVEEFAEQSAGIFDAVVCMEMLEHVPEPRKVIAACAKVLKPGGQASSRPRTARPKPFCLPSLAASIFYAFCRAERTATQNSSVRRN